MYSAERNSRAHEINFASPRKCERVARNQVGVVEYPDGNAYAVAIFTRANAPFERQHVIGRVIPEAAAIAVHAVRAAG